MIAIQRAHAALAFSIVVAVGVAAASAGAADPEAEAALEARGIVRVGPGYGLAAEADFGARLATLRSRADASRGDSARLAEAQGAVARLAELEQAFTDISANISELNFQMGQYPSTNRGGRMIRGANMQDDAEFQNLRVIRDGLVRQRDTSIVPERDTMRRQQLGPALSRATEAARASREAALGALSGAREAAGSTTGRYREIADDPEIKRALAKLGRARFGPSPEYLAGVDDLARFERSAGLKPKGIVPKPGVGQAGPAPKGRPAQAAPRAETLYNSAVQTEKNGKIPGAIALYREVVRRFPGTPWARGAADRLEALGDR